MKARCTAVIAFAGFLIAASAVNPTCLSAQTPAAPEKAQIPSRTTLAGSWKFNRNESDDSMQEVRSVESQRSIEAGGYSGGSGYPGGASGGYPGGAGGGYPGGAGGGYPGGASGYPGGTGHTVGGNPSANNGYPGSTSSAGMPRSTGYDIEDNPKMQPLIHPPQSLTVELKDSEIDLTGDLVYELKLFTDKHQLPKKSADDNRDQAAAHWSGSQLVSDEKSPLGGKMSRTFELSQDGRKLLETVHVDNRHSPALILHYVYDAYPTDAQNDPGKKSRP
jgi:hypothetical protein